MVNSIIIGAIIGAHYYKKGGRPLDCPTPWPQLKATTLESSKGLR
jgi:hypothetical protein